MLRRPAILHDAFEAGILIKFIDGIFELLGGSLLLFFSPASLNRFLQVLLREELHEDAKDFLANALLHLFQGLTAHQQLFAATYLLVHGLVKVGIVAALWSKRLWAYPVAGGVLFLFTLSQLYLLFSNPSPFLLVLTIVDIALLALLHSEYRRLACAPTQLF